LAMQAYEGYMENGQFFPVEQQMRISGRRRVILTVLDEPASKSRKKWTGNLSALDNPIQVSDFRVFSREELHER